MKKFSVICQKKEHISGAKVECHNIAGPTLFLDVDEARHILEILKSYRTFLLERVVIFRKIIPFYMGEVSLFLEGKVLKEAVLSIWEAPLFLWIFIFALCSLTDEKI